MARLTDSTGIAYLRLNEEVKITHPRHVAYGSYGSVERIDAARRFVWVRLGDGRLVRCGHRSVELT